MSPPKTEADPESPTGRFSPVKIVIIILASIAVLGTIGGIAYYVSGQGDNAPKAPENQDLATPLFDAPAAEQASVYEKFASQLAVAEKASVSEKVASKLEETIKSVKSVFNGSPDAESEEKLKSLGPSATKSVAKRLLWTRRNLIIAGVVGIALVTAIAASVALFFYLEPLPEDAIINPEEPTVRTKETIVESKDTVIESEEPIISFNRPGDLIGAPELTDDEILEESHYTSMAMKYSLSALLSSTFHVLKTSRESLKDDVRPWSFLNPRRNGNKGSWKDCWAKYRHFYIALAVAMVFSVGIGFAAWSSENTMAVLKVVAARYWNNVRYYGVLLYSLNMYLQSIILVKIVTDNIRALAHSMGNTLARNRKDLILNTANFLFNVAIILGSLFYPLVIFLGLFQETFRDNFGYYVLNIPKNNNNNQTP